MNNKPSSYTCHLPGFHCYGVAWSPFQVELLAVVSGTNYGLSGAGQVAVLTAAPQHGQLSPFWSSPWPDVVTDVTWSETNPSLLVAATGDRAITAFDIAKPGIQARPAVRREHGQEVSSVAWSLVRSHQALLSTSWDGSAKQWDAADLRCSQTFPVCPGRVYDAAWSPSEAGRFATASADGVLRVWSCAAGQQPVLSLPGCPAELLSCDWSRYSAHLLAAAGTDGCLRLWDVRSGHAPLHQLAGHAYAIKKVRFSAFDGDLIATASYDKTCRLWSVSGSRCVSVLTTHREFAYGLDWSVLERHKLATCGWDSSVRVHQLPS